MVELTQKSSCYFVWSFEARKIRWISDIILMSWLNKKQNLTFIIRDRDWIIWKIFTFLFLICRKYMRNMLKILHDLQRWLTFLTLNFMMFFFPLFKFYFKTGVYSFRTRSLNYFFFFNYISIESIIKSN